MQAPIPDVSLISESAHAGAQGRWPKPRAAGCRLQAAGAALGRNTNKRASDRMHQHGRTSKETNWESILAGNRMRCVVMMPPEACVARSRWRCERRRRRSRSSRRLRISGCIDINSTQTKLKGSQSGRRCRLAALGLTLVDRFHDPQRCLDGNRHHTLLPVEPGRTRPRHVASSKCSFAGPWDDPGMILG